MAAGKALVLLALSAGANGNFLQQQLGFEREQGLVRALEFNHRLRVCNAYPNSATLDIFRGESESLTSGSSMPYKSCRDLPVKMRAGDKLNFKVGEVSQGSFSVGELPENDAVLLLVVHKHDAASTALAFDSHVFGNIAGAQLAVIDTYKGSARATPVIKDETVINHHKSQKREKLSYSSVVAVNQGKYSVLLDDEQGREVSKSNLVALDHESYVVLRTGSESKEGGRFPEELVVFPQSDAARLPQQSGSAPVRASFGVLFALAVAAFSRA